MRGRDGRAGPVQAGPNPLLPPESSTTSTFVTSPFVTDAGQIAVAWIMEAQAHLLQAGRILELDPARRYQARHIFGLASRLAVAA
jgi:hypothetical protein